MRVWITVSVDADGFLPGRHRHLLRAHDPFALLTLGVPQRLARLREVLVRVLDPRVDGLTLVRRLEGHPARELVVLPLGLVHDLVDLGRLDLHPAQRRP